MVVAGISPAVGLRDIRSGRRKPVRVPTLAGDTEEMMDYATEEARKADYIPNFRHSDPRSSQDAGVAIEKKGRAAAQRQQALNAVWAHPGKTSKELSALTGMDRYALARRLPELLRTDCVRRTEEGECRWWPCSREPTQLKLWTDR